MLLGIFQFHFGYLIFQNIPLSSFLSSYLCMVVIMPFLLNLYFYIWDFWWSVAKFIDILRKQILIFCLLLFFFYFMYLFSNTYYLFPSNIGSSLLFTPCPSFLTCKSYWGLFYGLLYFLVCLRRICMSICYIMLFNYSIFCWFSAYSIIDSGYWNLQPS